MYKSQIVQIANILAINYQRLPSMGITKGYLGVVLFFYHYARYIGAETFNSFADDLLDYVIRQKREKIHHSAPCGFNELCWCIDYLLENNFIEADVYTRGVLNSMLSSDYTMIELENDIRSSFPIFSKSIVLNILSDNFAIEKTVSNIADLLKNISRLNATLTFVISVLHFFNLCEKKGVAINKIEKIKDELIFYIQKILASGNYQVKELYILEQVVKKGNYRIDIPTYKYDLLLDVYMNWQTVVYSDIILPDIVNKEVLITLLSDINFNVPIDKLSLEGICSLGINLIRKSKMNWTNPALQDSY